MSKKFIKIETSIEGLWIIEPLVYGDHRGFFMESYSERDFAEIGITERFVQDNHSKSKKGVLRGMHFQTRYTQGKLVRVTAGSVLDVVVDLRNESPTFGMWEAVLLSKQNQRMFYVPPRFGHGFLTLEDDSEFQYKCTEYYAPEYDCGIRWNDPTVNIKWNFTDFGMTEAEVQLSDKDMNLPFLQNLDFMNLFV